MIIIYSPKCLEYGEVGHPESPVRVGDSYQFLKEKNFEFVEPEPAQEKDLLLVHTKRLVEEVKNERILDLDTPNIKGIFNYALLSVGGALRAMEMALRGKISFSLMRPPGHHAGRDFCGGFCYFNNLAVAVAKALEKVNPVRKNGFLNQTVSSKKGSKLYLSQTPPEARFSNGVKKAAILDIDCHHGNGTEDIFLGKNNVLYVSLHQSPLYPGTGLRSQFNCLNFPLPAGTNEKECLKTLDIALEKISNFSPNILAISAGFDTYKKDPITNLNLETESYQKIGERIAKLNLPTFAALEGGYSSDLPQCIYNFLLGLES